MILGKNTRERISMNRRSRAVARPNISKGVLKFKSTTQDISESSVILTHANMEQLLEHIADEEEILEFHQWIRDLCHPDSSLVQGSGDKFQKICDQDREHSLLLSHAKNATDSLMTSTDLQDQDKGQKLLRSLANKYVRTR